MTPENKETDQPQGVEQRLAELTQQAYQALRGEEYDRAQELFEVVLQEDAANSYALVGLGDTARKQRDFASAVTHYQACLETDTENSYALFGLADSFRAQRRYHQALKIWERYLKHDDKNVTVLTRVADSYRKVRDKKRSHQLYERVLELEAGNPYALIGLGHLHYDFREYDEALASWMRVLEATKERPDIRVLTSIGNCYRKLKDFQKGIPFFDQALEREAGNFYALFGLADCYRGLSDPQQSLIYWNQILEKDPSNKVILTRAGDAHRVMGELDRAETQYKLALNIEYDTYAILGLALIDRERGKSEDAIASMAGLKDQDPSNHRIYIELAHTYGDSGQPEDAVRVLQEYLDRGTPNSYISELLERYRRA